MPTIPLRSKGGKNLKNSLLLTKRCRQKKLKVKYRSSSRRVATCNKFKVKTVYWYSLSDKSLCKTVRKIPRWRTSSNQNQIMPNKRIEIIVRLEILGKILSVMISQKWISTCCLILWFVNCLSVREHQGEQTILSHILILQLLSLSVKSTYLSNNVSKRTMLANGWLTNWFLKTQQAK